jgi:hypothetical protein
MVLEEIPHSVLVFYAHDILAKAVIRESNLIIYSIMSYWAFIGNCWKSFMMNIYVVLTPTFSNISLFYTMLFTYEVLNYTVISLHLRRAYVQF